MRIFPIRGSAIRDQKRCWSIGLVSFACTRIISNRVQSVKLAPQRRLCGNLPFSAAVEPMTNLKRRRKIAECRSSQSQRRMSTGE